MKIVFDTNVLIAAFITQGVCSILLEHCVQRHELVTSDFILGEFRKHMGGKFKYSQSDVEEAINLLQSRMTLVTPADMETPICRDPDDDTVLATALAGKAQCIVTGDKDLLIIKKFQLIDLIHPSQFAEYEAQNN